MGNNKIKKVTNGTDNLRTKNFSQLKRALSEDIACRTDDGELSASAASIGTDTYPFDEIVSYNGTILTGTKTTQEYTSSDTFEAPPGVYAVYVVAAGGGAYQAGTPYGAGGGVAAAWYQVTPGETYTITISSNNANFESGDLIGYGATVNITYDYSLPGYGDGDEELFPLLVSGGRSALGQCAPQGTIFANAGTNGGGAGYKDGATAGGGFTAASGTTPGAAGVSITYWLQSGVTDPN